MATAYFVARLLSCGLWLATGVYSLFHYRETMAKMAANHVPLPALTLTLVNVMKFAGAYLLLTNQYVWAAALAWIAFIVPATLMFHLRLYDAQGRFVFPELIQLSKNVSLTGGLLALILLDPGKPQWLVDLLA